MNKEAQAHTVWQSIGLHLFPGALLTIFYFLTAPLIMKAGYPALMALLLAILIILIPFELGYLLYQGKKQNGTLSLKNVVLYREGIPFWQYLLIVPVLVAWSAAVFISFAPLDTNIIRTFFTWLPSWLTQSLALPNFSLYPKTTLVATLIMSFAMNGIAGPLVEELYFRGYLLPRIPSSRVWAPLINALLFSLYHFFSPWQNLTRILALIPMVYAVSWKRNIYLSIFTHCLLNSLGMISSISLLMTQ